jgi:hypothetical protein
MSLGCGGRYLRQRRSKGEIDVGLVTSVAQEDALIRRQCRQGTERYRRALIRAGHLRDGSAEDTDGSSG